MDAIPGTRRVWLRVLKGRRIELGLASLQDACKGCGSFRGLHPRLISAVPPARKTVKCNELPCSRNITSSIRAPKKKADLYPQPLTTAPAKAATCKGFPTALKSFCPTKHRKLVPEIRALRSMVSLPRRTLL